jgi:ligand-binding sensor protein
MELAQLLSIDRWGAIETDIYNIYNLQGSVFNTDGIRITETKNWSNSLCPAIKSTDQGQSYICAVAHMNMAKQAMETKKLVVEECDAGMLKLVVPIFYGKEYLGVIGGCGVLAYNGEIDDFAINKITGISKQTIQALSSKIPTMSHKKTGSVFEYIKGQLETILDKYKERV